MHIAKITITFKALERELNLPEGTMIVGVQPDPHSNQFFVKIACDRMPRGCAPETFAEIGGAFQNAISDADYRAREEALRTSIHF